MEFREWPLLIFTILMQMAIGAFIILWVAHLVARRQAGESAADRLATSAFPIVTAIAVVGVLASFAHLGNVRNAPYVFTNIKTSWLSREVALGVLFTGALVVYSFLQWRKLGGLVLRDVIGAAATLLGLALLFATARAYMLTTVPVWNNFGTPITFCATACILGGLSASAILALGTQKALAADPQCADTQCQLLRGTLRWASLVGVAGLALLLVTTVLQWAYFAANASQGSQLLFTRLGGLLAVRLVLVILGAGLLGLFLNRAAATSGQLRAMTNLAVMAFVVALAAEVTGRYLFYAVFSRIGL